MARGGCCIFDRHATQNLTLSFRRIFFVLEARMVRRKPCNREKRGRKLVGEILRHKARGGARERGGENVGVEFFAFCLVQFRAQTPPRHPIFWWALPRFHRWLPSAFCFFSCGAGSLFPSGRKDTSKKTSFRTRVDCVAVAQQSKCG